MIKNNSKKLGMILAFVILLLDQSEAHSGYYQKLKAKFSGGSNSSTSAVKPAANSGKNNSVSSKTTSSSTANSATNDPYNPNSKQYKELSAKFSKLGTADPVLNASIVRGVNKAVKDNLSPALKSNSNNSQSARSSASKSTLVDPYAEPQSSKGSSRNSVPVDPYAEPQSPRSTSHSNSTVDPYANY